MADQILYDRWRKLEREADDPDGLKTPTKAQRQQLNSRIIRETQRMGTYHLIGKDREIYEELNRTESEADLQILVAIPLGAVAAALTVTENPWWLLLLLASASLALSASENYMSCVVVLLRTIQAGRVDAAFLADIDKRLAELGRRSSETDVVNSPDADAGTQSAPSESSPTAEPDPTALTG